MRHRLQTTFTLIALWLTACLPLLRGHLPWRGDGILHLYRLAHLQRAVANGDFYPRWLPDLALGYGFPLFNYYAPLSYYFALPFASVSSPQIAIRVAYILAQCLTGFAIFTWSRRVWQNESAALLSSATIVFSPYILFNIHERGAFAEAWGIALIALTFSAVDALIDNPTRRNWLLTTLSVAALLLIHNISALIAAPLLAVYVLWRNAPPNRMRAFALPVSAALCGVGVTTFFWLPALQEQNLVQIGRLTQDPAFDFRNHFLTLRTLFAWPQSADPTQVNPTIPFGISLPATLLAIYALGAFPRRRESQYLGLTIVVLSLLMLPLARPIWETLPLISFLQFPWRLGGVISLFAAVLAGGAIPALSKWGDARLAVLGVIVLGYGLFWLFPAQLQSPLDLSVDGSIQYEVKTGALGTTSSADYLPSAVQTLSPPTHRHLTTNATAQIDEFPRYLGTSATVSHHEVWEINYQQFYFAGWTATLDGEPLVLSAVAESGVIAAEIPAGTHRLEINWRTTPIRRTAALISLAFSLISILAVVTLRPKTVSPLTSASQQFERRNREVRHFALIILSIALLKIFLLNQTNNFWHNPLFDGETVRGTDFSADANFQNVLILRAYDLPSRAIPANQPIPITLYLQSAVPVDFNPAISIHLVDAQDRFFGQSDQYRPANFPISRWQPTEYAADHHQLQPLPLTPPGTYIVRLFVLNDRSGARLNLLNAAGQPIGNHIELGTITLARGDSTDFNPVEWLGQTEDVALDMEGVLPPAQVGDMIPLVLFWGAVGSAPQQRSVQFELHDAAGNLVAVQPFEPLNAAFQFNAMRPAERWRDPQTFRVAAIGLNGQPLASGDYALSVAIGDTAIPLRGTLALVAPQRTFDRPTMQHTIDAPIGDAAILLGYDLDAETATLYWQAQREFTTGYARFVHVLDANGTILAQVDGVPARGTTGWISAEIITDSLPLSIPESATHLAIGLYDPQSNTRLAEPLSLPIK
jgi:hypothetical protein